MRQADCRVINGVVQTGGGTSMFDKQNIFGTKYWCCFEIPDGTVVPPELLLTGPKFNSGYGANHYQIEARIALRLDVFKNALDNLARNAIVRACELGRLK